MANQSILEGDGDSNDSPNDNGGRSTDDGLPEVQPHSKATIVTINGSKQGFKSPRHLKKHFNKHNAKFDPPFANEQEYEQAGIEFMKENEENDPDIVYQASFYCTSSIFHGDLVRYNETRNLFGMKTRKGVLRTFYPPVNGILEFFNTFTP